MKVNYDLFGEDVDFDEAISLIRFDEFEGVDNVEDVLDYNSGWYNYSVVTFDYEGKRYSIEYKEHTSDNVCDLEYLTETFVCLGSVEDMNKQISGEDLARMKAHYEERLDISNQELIRYKQVLNSLDVLSPKRLKELGDMFIETHKDIQKEEKAETGIDYVGEFLKELSKFSSS